MNTKNNYCGFTTKGNGGEAPVSKRGKTQMKIIDNLSTTSSVSTSGAILPGLSGPSQGVALNQRTGDVIYLEKMYITYTVNAANTDVFSSFRVIIFQWHPNSALAAPTVADILQNSSYNVYAMYDWNFSNQYTILYDRIHSMAGIATAPTASTNQVWSGEITLARAVKRSVFQLGTTFGSEQLYCLAISDSGVTPFPVFTIGTRITYSEE